MTLAAHRAPSSAFDTIVVVIVHAWHSILARLEGSEATAPYDILALP
jgi:hypothetical protein